MERSGIGVFFADLARVVVHPRVTIRRLLEQPAAPWIPLVVLALVAGFFGDFDGAEYADAVRQVGAWIYPIIAGALVLGALLMVLFFQLFSWIIYQLGRLFEGSGSFKQVRLALAWGLAPAVWSLLYKVPFALVTGTGVSGKPNVEASEEGFVFDPGAFSSLGCGTLAVVTLLEVAVTIWVLVIMSNTLAEAHRFSAWRAFGAIVACCALPLLILVAAILAAVI